MSKKKLTPSEEAERELELPRGWLRVQAAACLIPHLRADNRVLVHVPTIRRLLLDRACQTPRGAK
jgi:hypothetical protein